MHSSKIRTARLRIVLGGGIYLLFCKAGVEVTHACENITFPHFNVCAHSSNFNDKFLYLGGISSLSSIIVWLSCTSSCVMST